MSKHTAPVTVGQAAPISLDRLQGGLIPRRHLGRQTTSDVHGQRIERLWIMPQRTMFTDGYLLAELHATTLVSLERAGEDLNDYTHPAWHALGIRI